MKTKNVTKRIVTWFMAIAVVATSLALPQTAQMVYAAEVAAAPDANTFITNESGKGFQATDFNTIYNLYKDDGKSQKVYFGTNNGSQTWYIAGKNSDGTLILMCDPKKPLKTKQNFTDYDSFERTWKMRKERYNNMNVYANHYGPSNVRNYLNGEALDLFTVEEQNLMSKTSIYTFDAYNKSNVDRIEDKLYLAYGHNGDVFITVGNNEEKSLDTSIKIAITGTGKTYATGGNFWLRAPVTEYYFDYGLCAEPGENVDKGYVTSSYRVVPAFHLNLTSVLFASSASAATSPATLSDAMTFRYKVTGKVLSTAVYDNNGIKVTKKGDDEYLYVQYKDGDTDKVWSKKIEANMNIYKDCVGVDSFANCKIWIEKKNTTTNLTYAVMATRGSSGVIEHTYGEYGFNNDATCGANGTKTRTCVVCDCKDTVEAEGTATGNHDFTEQKCVPIREGMHVQICKNCVATRISKCIESEAFEENRVEPTCDTKGSYDEVIYCTECGQVLDKKTEEIVATGNHDFIVSSNDSSKHICSVCSATEGHIFTVYISDDNATCGDNGTKTRKCEVCGYEDTVEDEGTATGNHEFSNYQYQNNATCKENGTEIGTCICGATDEREVPNSKLDIHTYVNGVCSVCDKIWEVTENGITYKVVTEEKDGKPVGVTVSGNDVESVAVSVVSANTVEESVSNNSVVIAGELTGNGTNQKYIVTKIEKDAFTDSGMNSLVIPATVTELGENALGNASTVTFEGMNPPTGIDNAIKEGATVNIPEGSGEYYQNVFNIQIIINEAHTHKFAEEWTYDKDNHWKASTCGHDETVVKLTHTFGDWITVKEATETEAGSKKRVCACGYEETEPIAKLEVKPSDKPADVKPSEKPSEDVKPSESPKPTGDVTPSAKPSADVKPSEQPKLTKQTITVAKAAKKTVTFKASKLKAKKATIKLGAKAKTKLSYKVSKYPKNAKKYISVSSKGVVTMKKGAKKGTYKVTITAKADKKYAKATKVITIKVK